MGRHLTAAELDRAHRLQGQGKLPTEIHAAINASRMRRKPPERAPHLTNIRNALKGTTFRRGKKETRAPGAKTDYHSETASPPPRPRSSYSTTPLSLPLSLSLFLGAATPECYRRIESGARGKLRPDRVFA